MAEATSLEPPNRQAACTRKWPAAVLVGVITLAVFSPVIGHQFLTWDDESFLVENTAYRGLTGEHLGYLFTGSQTFGYLAPVTWFSFTIDYFTSGVSARGVHLHNLLLHAANAVLLFLLARRLLTAAMPGSDTDIWAAVAALLFALHPLRVEPVAWACARGYLLAGLWGQLALLAYLSHVDSRKSGRSSLGWLILSVGLMTLSLLAVPLAVGFVVVLLALDVYPLRRLPSRARDWWKPGHRRILAGKLPFLVIGLITAGLAPLAKSAQGSISHSDPLSWRLATAACGFACGVGRTLWPGRLSPLYQAYPTMDPAEARYLVSAAVVLAITMATIAGRKRYPAAAVAWLSYVVLMLPVSGLVQYGLQVTADRYSYLAAMGLAVLAAGTAAWSRSHLRTATLPGVVVVGVLVALGVLTWRYQSVWHDSERLWTRVVELDPRSYTGLNNLGVVRERQGRIPEAADLFKRSAAVWPEYPPLQNNLGNIAAFQGRLDEAIAHYRAYLAFKPAASKTRIMLATVLARRGLFDEAVEQARIVEGEQASTTRLISSIGTALVAQGHDGASIDLIRAGLKQRPDDPVLLNNLAWSLATSYEPACRNGPQALQAATRAIQLAGHRSPPQFFATLAAALAENGRFDEARAQMDLAIEAARRKGEDELAGDYAGLARKYVNRVPHHEDRPALSPWALPTGSAAVP
jgi:tetratricopeptide (TPR) repeat protein